MTENSRLIRATRRAENFLKEKGICTIPVNPFEIAEMLEIAVQAKPIDKFGVSGMLVRHGNNFGIYYSTNISSRGFQRFSVAHEIGHYMLDGHADYIFSNGTAHASRGGFVSDDTYEREADYFAAGLLMPDPMFSKEMAKHPDGMYAIKALAQKCETSLTAAAIRYAQKTVAPVAVVVSEGKTIRYCFMSEALKEYKGLDWPRKNAPLPASVRTYEFNMDPENILNRKEDSDTTDLVSWFGGNREVDATEEIIGLGAYGKTMTVISLKNFADEGDEDRDIEESWRVTL